MLLLVGMGDGGADGIRIPLRLTSDVQAAGPRSPKNPDRSISYHYY